MYPISSVHRSLKSGNVSLALRTIFETLVGSLHSRLLWGEPFWEFSRRSAQQSDNFRHPVNNWSSIEFDDCLVKGDFGLTVWILKGSSYTSSSLLGPVPKMRLLEFRLNSYHKFCQMVEPKWYDNDYPRIDFQTNVAMDAVLDSVSIATTHRTMAEASEIQSKADKGKIMLSEPEIVSLRDIKLTHTKKTIKVRVYRKWIARNVKTKDPSNFGCILLDKE
ncbi:hypothetical protein Tco_0641749, partial [Tanacetum coccineum]